MNKILSFTFFFIITQSTCLFAQDLFIYSLDVYEKDKNNIFAFTSLSDNYVLNTHPDSLAIPNFQEIPEKDAEYFALDSTYRNRFLRKLQIAENDTVFVYNYAVNEIKSFSVKSLNVVARLNIYGPDKPYSQFDYMIGFELNSQWLKGLDNYFANSLVYVGKTNPFILNQLKPIVWKKTDPKNLPNISLHATDAKNLRQSKTTKGKAYTFQMDGLTYFAQEFVKGGKTTIRRLLVTDQNKKIVFDRMLYEHESASLAPLNFTQPDLETNQWTGKLFQNKPPVLFGFEYVSFGCPSILFLKSTEKDIYLSCDNRH
jgi:hypothetical protein